MMRLKRAVALIGAALIVLIIIEIYSTRDFSEFVGKKLPVVSDDSEKWSHLEDRLKQLEHDLNRHGNEVQDIKNVIKNIIPLNTSASTVRKTPHRGGVKPVITEFLFESNCPFQLSFIPKTDIQMLEVYHRLKFDNPDGGVWKQGWKIEVDEKDWNRQNKLKVFVVPHSHNDPGWVKTVEDYYLTQTKHILNNMLLKLPEDPRRKFIWAEISYFSMWWDDLREDEREVVKKLLRNNQLEIVTGGWVMNDEANAHWIAVMQQLTEGHQWLQQNLNYTPISSWSIDPFGMSSTQPVLLKEMGFRNMLMQRVHYSIKKEFASRQQLEFRWRQLWDGSGKTDIFTHMMPFYSYDVPHTCGPDPKICCQFDFKRLPGHGLHCPWKVPPQEITEKNVAYRAELLLDQYRKKSKLYKTNVVLAPLGDDFRYDHSTEWDVQFRNYQKLFDYMNANLNLNVQAQFGTLSDYFDAVHKERKDNDFPSLSGDFFTYADRDDHYWSGYYTSRPFYKRMDRILLANIRAAEIILTLAYLSGKPGSAWIGDREVGLEKQLSDARKSLSLFQHHDAITGTSKDHVVVDFGKKMLAALNNCHHVIQHSAHILFSGKDAETPDHSALFYNIDDVRHSHDTIGEKYQITIGPELRTKRIAIFNSLTFSRVEVVTFHVSTPYVEVLDAKKRRVKCQISPIFEYGASMSQTKYQLSFVANVPAFGLVSYTIGALWEYESPAETVRSSIRIYNQFGEVQAPIVFTDIEVSPSTREFTLQNNRLTASFNALGLLKALKVGGNTVPVHLDFAKYGVRQSEERSGGYLFLPDGDAIPIQIENTIVNVIQGPIVSAVTVQLPYVRHTVTLYSSTGADSLGIEIENIVDISKTSNFELVMRLSTNIQSSDQFYTDLNGFEVIRRKRFHKLPLQANYYPIPSMAYIEDATTRLTLLTGSPLGTTSLRQGQIEVMLDRRLNQDDNLGMGQPVLDNHPTKHVFRVLLEQKGASCRATTEGHPAGFPTLSSYVSSQSLLNPLVRLLRTEDEDTQSQPNYLSVESEFGVDFMVPTLRTGVTLKGQDHVGFVLHRQFVDVCFADSTLLKQFPLSQGSVNISALLPTETGSKLHKTSLSFLLMKNEVNIRGDFVMCPMEIQAFVLQR
ncbi:alpha-mannosidase 2 [Tribolium castaneum]|uniref:Alpha-mannosidase n=1 Tax=Tribolium castaneum TaxID=7070 RepID=D6WTA9_TRICA|nr:PREDICTED: alpha-mannosidase 2 [Tribolium castaneum]XP_015836827.1 PREDICTED: alpha-mannosidase 2 [Tribolium castaneum]EFA06316.1 Alpha-mannosidase 2-like Protein [Tribolium castaneum]|eukprot:XP_015836826.1 PREDICTED: alpha-mannosidase 2 [Tribolium castaneum]